MASLFCGYLISLGVQWQGLFYWPATLALIIALISLLVSRGSPRDIFPDIRFGKNAGQKKPVADFHSHEYKVGVLKIAGDLIRIPLFRQVVTFSFFTHILRSFFMFWIPKFMVDLGMGNLNAALTSAVFPLVGCLGTVILGYYTDRYSQDGDRASVLWKMLFALATTLAGIAFLVPFHLEFQWVIVILFGFAGFFLYGPYSMSAGCLTLDIAGPEGAGTCTGLIDGVGYIGGALAAWGAGVIADQKGWEFVFWVLSICALITTSWAYYMSWFAQRKVKGA